MSWLLTDVGILKGTGYFELLPGRYTGKCWNAESVFLTEDAFAHVEPMVDKHRPGFDRYSFREIPRSQWMPIVADLSRMRDFLASEPTAADVCDQVGFHSASHKDVFVQDFGRNLSELHSTFADLVRWIREILKSHDAISVLGL